MKNAVHILMGLSAQTAIHAGASSNEDMIDLPIQRESHTDWPMVAGSGVKGAWRAKASQDFPDGSNDFIEGIFGPDTQNAAAHASAISVSDARLLLLPVRSLNSHFKWVTCPALLKRFFKDKKRMGAESLSIDYVLNDETAFVFKPSAVTDTGLYLEEFRFSCELSENEQLIEHLLAVMSDTDKAELEQQLVIISDDQFRYFCRAAIPVQTRIALESKTKVVKQGALWTEESLPAETIMYNCLTLTNSRKELPTKDASALAEWFVDTMMDSPYLQVGGNATVGMGWFSLKQIELK